MKITYTLLALLLLISCAPQIIPEPETNQTNATTGAQKGDLVKINFILTLENGTIVDTNDAELAQQNELTNYVKGTYAFILGQSGKVKGFDEAIIGMEAGETRDATIEPSEPEIIIPVNKTRIVNRFTTIPRKQSFPLASFQNYFNKKPIVNDVVYNKELQFKYKVLNVTEKHVIAEIFAKEGEKYTLTNTEWESAVSKITNEDILFYQMPDENKTLETPFGTGKVNLTGSRIIITFEPEMGRIFNRSVEIGGIMMPQTFQVTEIRDGDFLIKRHGLLADKKLQLHAEMLEITPNVKEVRESKINMKQTV